MDRDLRFENVFRSLHTLGSSLEVLSLSDTSLRRGQLLALLQGIQVQSPV